MDEAYVRELVEVHNLTHEEISVHLRTRDESAKGLSVRSVQRFCATHDIHRLSSVSGSDLDVHVQSAVEEVGAKYGRRMMTGVLRSKGINAAEMRVADSLQRVQPYNHEQRQRGTHKQLNPVPYYAPYFGYSWHADQNEKLIDFGITMVVGVDGKSNYVTSFSVMPVKNNITIYKEVFLYVSLRVYAFCELVFYVRHPEELRSGYQFCIFYRPAVETFGLWETVIVDCGREFYLSVYMQQYYRERCAAITSNRPPYRQVKSTTNNRVERYWSEVNQRVGYPVKSCLIDLVNNHGLSMDDPWFLYAMSTVAIPVVRHGMETLISAWNKHTVRGKGIPESFVSQRRNVPIQTLDAIAAQASYEQQSNSKLTDPHHVGRDIVHDEDKQKQRDSEFWQELQESVGDVKFIFGKTANGDFGPLQTAIKLYIQISDQFQ